MPPFPLQLLSNIRIDSNLHALRATPLSNNVNTSMIIFMALVSSLEANSADLCSKP